MKDFTQPTWLHCPFMYCNWSTNDQGSFDNHMFVLHGHKKENKMNDQMEQVWRSKDGKCVGSREEVEAYLATLSPLGKMRFPYWDCNGEVRTSDESGNWTLGRNGIADTAALVAFANLAPLIQKMLEGCNETESDWRDRPYPYSHAARSEQKLLLAYEEALKLVPR